MITILTDPSGDYDCLLNDFQFLLDTTGRFYFIDLDRCANPRPKECEICLDPDSFAPGMKKLLFWLTQATTEDFLHLQQQIGQQEISNGNNSTPSIPLENFGQYFFQPKPKKRKHAKTAAFTPNPKKGAQ